jgi:hypothetical protein
MDITVHVKGPLLVGSTSIILAEIAQEAQREVGKLALERVHFFLNAQIKHPTPYYETQIIQQQRDGKEVVHDRGIVYGPWLEGTSSRNATTRFKGYASFRKARNSVRQLAPAIVNRVVAKNLGRLQ